MGCAEQACATLSFNYSTRQVWITDLREEPDPASHDLCVGHAERFVVPVGWALQDLRLVGEAPPGYAPDAAL